MEEVSPRCMRGALMCDAGMFGAVRRKVVLFILLGCVAIGYGLWRFLALLSSDDLPALHASEVPLRLKISAPGGREVSQEESLLLRESARAAKVDGAKEVKVMRYPVAVSAYVRDGKKLLNWLENDKEFQSFLESGLVKGIFDEVIKTASVRAEDVSLKGAKGAIVKQLLRDIVCAEFALHYDITRGSKGFVAQFNRQKSELARSLLPIVTSGLSKRTYRVPGIQARIHEILLGEQTALLVQSGKHVFVSNGMTALLNVLDQTADAAALSSAAGGRTLLEPPLNTDATLALTVRSEAFFDKLLPLVAGREEWHMNVQLVLSEKGLEQQNIRTDPALVFRSLAPKLPKGILAAIPHDSFVGLAGSFSIPSDFDPRAWYEAATKAAPVDASKAQAAMGLGLVWDVSKAAGSGLSQVGIIVGGNKDFPIEQYANDGMHTARCAGDSVALLSNSPQLLTRMRESCERQSPSVLAQFDGELPQLVLAVNPAPGFGQMIESGIEEAKEEQSYVSNDQPEWKTRYQEALGRKQSEAMETVAKIPGFLFSGQASEQGATLVGRFVHALGGGKGA